MRWSGVWIFTLMLLLAASVAPARANLITDPGFESCPLVSLAPPDWTASSEFAYCGEVSHTGNFSGEFSTTGGALSQTITTITGDNYDFSFWLSDEAPTPASFAASFGSDEVLDLVNSARFAYKKEDFTVTATGTSTTITFRAVALGGAIWDFDDVSITDQSPVAPEPASLLLLATGLLAIAWRYRHQRRT